MAPPGQAPRHGARPQPAKLPPLGKPRLLGLCDKRASPAKTRANQINFASAGVGTNPHLTMELFLSMTGTRMTHVPYKGSGQGIIDVLAGHVPVMTPSVPTAAWWARSVASLSSGCSTSNHAVGSALNRLAG